MITQNYVEQLIQRQDQEGWSDREMARQIGVSNATWTRIKSGDRRMGVNVLRRTMQRFPEYDIEALFFLRRDANVASISAPATSRVDEVPA